MTVVLHIAWWMAYVIVGTYLGARAFAWKRDTFINGPRVEMYWDNEFEWDHYKKSGYAGTAIAVGMFWLPLLLLSPLLVVTYRSCRAVFKAGLAPTRVVKVAAREKECAAREERIARMEKELGIG